jgi:putative ABC transport system ATP-binding protein
MTNESSTINGMPEGNVVILQDVKKEYHVRGRDAPVKALRGATLTIKEGSMVAIKGESGSGKTTLLQMIGALDIPTSGTVIVAGRDLSNMNESELTEHRAKTIGIVFQSFYLIPNLTALENVELAMEALNVPKEERRSRAADLLELVGMKDRMDYKPLKLSGGEQQRVAIARSLANNPSIILADEPTGNLDSRIGREIIRLLAKLRKEKGTNVIIVTHSESAAKACDFTFTIHDGVIASMKDLASEDEIKERRDHLRSDLAVSGKVMGKLIAADYESLEKIAHASLDELVMIVGDKIVAKKIEKNAKSQYEKELAKKINLKKVLSTELSLPEEIIEKLFNAGLESVESMDNASFEDLDAIIGDSETAERVAKKVEAMMNE